MKLNSNEVVVCRRNYNSDKELFDALGDITIDRLAFNDNCSLSGAGNIFD